TDSGTTNLVNDTITGNLGGGILNGAGGTVNATNSIIAGNFPASPTIITNLGKRDCQQPLSSVTATIASIATGTETKCGPASGDLRYYGGSAEGNPNSATVLSSDVKVGPLANNGGTTETRALLAGSPAIDAGGAGCPDSDQRGATRVGQCDIGAFEY